MIKSLKTAYCFFKIKIILVIIVFLVEFIQNNLVFADEEFKKCGEFVDPSNLEDLHELRLCIKKIKYDKVAEKESLIIRNSYQGSLVLTEKLNIRNSKKSNQIISEKNEKN